MTAPQEEMERVKGIRPNNSAYRKLLKKLALSFHHR